MKQNPELIEKIRRMAEQGMPAGEIAKELKVSPSTALYWADEAYREKTRKRSSEHSLKLYREGKLWADKNPEKYKAWYRQYQKGRYDTEPEFREKMKEANRKRMARLRKQKVFKSSA